MMSLRHGQPDTAGLGMTSQRARDRLVDDLRAKGIADARVLDAIRTVPRHLFIDEALASGDLEQMRDALQELKRLQAHYLNWTGKAERTSFEVDTVSLHVHERVDPATILANAAKRLVAGHAVAFGLIPGLQQGRVDDAGRHGVDENVA